MEIRNETTIGSSLLATKKDLERMTLVHEGERISEIVEEIGHQKDKKDSLIVED